MLTNKSAGSHCKTVTQGLNNVRKNPGSCLKGTGFSPYVSVFK